MRNIIILEGINKPLLNKYIKSLIKEINYVWNNYEEIYGLY